MDRLTQLELFVLVAELGSLSKVAERMDLSNAAVTRYLGALEERLGVRLVERTTRRLWLTEAGHEFLQRSQAIVEDVRAAESAMRDVSTEPVGLLRVTCSLSFAVNQIGPVLPEFRCRYPKLRVEVVVANRYPDFIEAGIDVAIRTREHEPDSCITVRPLAETRRILAASPGYLARNGIPRAIEDLEHHDFLVYTLARNPYELDLSRGDQQRWVKIQGVLESNDGQVLRAAAIAGHGILIQPLYIVHDDVVAGRLMPVLDDWELPRLTINIAYQSRRHLAPKIRAFIDFMLERIEQQDFRRKWAAPMRQAEA